MPSRHVALDVPPDPSFLVDVRRAIDALPLPAEVREDARLLVSELVANSVRHSGIGPGGRIRVAAEVTDDRLRVEVRDGGAGPPASLAGGIRPRPGADSGWGLYLVASLAERWGFGPGAHWFELDLRAGDDP